MSRSFSVALYIFVLILCFGIPARVCIASSPLVIHKIASAPVVDGSLSETCWKTATVLPMQVYTGGIPKAGGKVAVCYDDKNIYVAYWLEEPAPSKMQVPKVAVNSTEIWSGELLEIFINPTPDGVEYFHLAVNPSGSKYNAKMNAASQPPDADLKWNPEWRSAAKIGDKGWTSEIAIPFSSLGQKAPVDGTRWSMNFGRTRKIGGTEYTSVSVLPSGFHSPGNFLNVWFDKFVPPVDSGDVEQSGQVRALIGCWRSAFGYDSLLYVRDQLQRALGVENVDIRVRDTGITGAALENWPTNYEALRKYSLIVITDLPTASFSARQMDDLRTYVQRGGNLVMITTLSGWLHDKDKPWTASPLKDLLPVDPPYAKPGYRKVNVDSSNPLFKGFPSSLELTVRAGLCKPTTDSQVHATVGLLDDESTNTSLTPGAFITEKKTGKGSMVVIHGNYCQESTTFLLKHLKTDFFQSAHYPLFWDNLLLHLTKRPANFPAAPVSQDNAENASQVQASIDIISDNYGDIFRPGSKLRISPALSGNLSYPYEVQAYIECPGKAVISSGTFPLSDKSSSIVVDLPYLDQGIYNLRLDLIKQAGIVCTTLQRFSIALPLLAADEFNFSVFSAPDYLDEKDCTRIASELKSIGFTGIGTLGGVTVGAYPGMMRTYREALYYSRMQDAGLRVRPVWYPILYNILTSQPVILDSTFPPAPDPAFPNKQFLPFEHSWLNAFGENIYGRMPLTDGLIVGDELVGIWMKMSDKLAKGYQAIMGTAPAKDAKDPSFYNIIKYQEKVAANLIWLCRSVTEAYKPSWITDSIISPNSFAGHTSPLCDLFATISSLGASSPDEYWYGEPKLYQKSLSSMAILWSASNFGKLSIPGFTGGQLANNYYMEFPEQVFAALSAGAREFKVFYYDTASFEKNGCQDMHFADIAKRTTADAARIGRTLNHYNRSRARVALLYPNTAHIIKSMGVEFNPDYLKMTGTSSQYLDMTYAVQAEFDLLRRMFGHVDVIFDEQVKRGELKNYDLVVVGYCKQIEEVTLRGLKKYAEKGGTLLVSSDSGQFNESQKQTGTLYNVLPAKSGKERNIVTDYSETRMQKTAEWSIGNTLLPKKSTKVLFSFADKTAACVRGSIGRGEAILLGMPIAALKAAANETKLKLLSNALNKRVQLISKPQDGEFSAITFTNERDGGRIFLIANHNKADAKTRVLAYADQDEAKYTLADIANGEQIPFTVKDGVMVFDVSVSDRWGRSLALLKESPASVEVSVSGKSSIPGRRFMIMVRLLGRDGQPVQATLPFDLKVTDPKGNIRDDLSGVRIADQGVYTFSMMWPVNANTGKWTVTVSEKISAASDNENWEVK